jgi:hypothetical protein
VVVVVAHIAALGLVLVDFAQVLDFRLRLELLIPSLLVLVVLEELPVLEAK